jgi:hypothetical protein
MGGSAEFRAKKHGAVQFYVGWNDNGNVTIEVENEKTGQVATVSIPVSMWHDDPQEAIKVLRRKAHQKGMYFPKKVDSSNDFHKVTYVGETAGQKRYYGD